MQNTAAAFKPLTNRNPETTGGQRFTLPADGFVQVVPIGTAPNRFADGTPLVQLVDEEAVTAMYNRLIAQGGEVLIDYDHQSHEADKSTEAAGWLPLNAEHLQNRGADGLFGKPRWSDGGEAALTGGKFRYISPEFPPAKDLLVNVSGKIWRPLAVTGFGLTNRPGFRQFSKPLTNSKPDAGKTPEPHPDTDPMHKDLLALALGLNATELEKLDETTLRNRVQEHATQHTAGKAAVTELEALKNREADAFVQEHGKVLKNDTIKAHVRAEFLKNRDTAKMLVESMKSDDDGEPPRKPLHNRGEADVEALKTRDRQDNDLHNRAMAYRDQHKVTYEQALAACRHTRQS